MDKYDPKKILVPVDFSEHSEKALLAAKDIAEHRGATLTLLHVMAEPQTSVPYEVYVDWDKLKVDIRKDAERQIEEMAAKVCGGKGATEVRWGEPTSTIAKVAGEDGFDLIVMGTHGRSGLGRLFLGSVAESVIRHSPCPVLVLRGGQ